VTRLLGIRHIRPALRVPPAVMRLGVRLLGRRCHDPALPWPVQRTRLNQLARASLLPRGIAVSQQLIGGVPSAVVTCGDPFPPRTLIHFHGGGYCTGSAHTALSWSARLGKRAGCRVVLPEYRLAPEHPYPAALDDAHAIVTALLADAEPGSVVLSGDSAGGGLALALLVRLRDQGAELPGGCILLSPWLDLGRDWRSVPALARRDVLLSPAWLEACADAYSGPSARRDPAISPLRADHAGLPPLLIQAGTDELVAPDAEQLAASAAAAGVDVTYTSWPGMWHDFMLQPGLLAAADRAMSQAVWFVAKMSSE
jgi:epsilon-lactone hydrolase